MQWKNRSLVLIALALAVVCGACDAPDPAVNRPTSGRLILFVDEMYVPLVSALADSFMVMSPNAKIEIRPAPARMAVEQLINTHIVNARGTDTTASVGAILGRRLIADEREVIDGTRLELREYLIAHDGLAFIVPVDSPLRSSDLSWMRSTMASPLARLSQIDSTAGNTPARFLVPDQNSSTFMVLRQTILGDSNIAAPARYFQSGDSVIEAVVAGEGIGIVGWYTAIRDTSRVRPLRIGYTDSTGKYSAPVGINPATLVTMTYPVKQPLIGYTMSLTKSLATGFLAWIALSGAPQRYITEQGLQSENIRYRLEMDEAAE